MITLLAAVVLTQFGEARFGEETRLTDPYGGPSRMLMRRDLAKLTTVKRSPLHNWEFEWAYFGYGRVPSSPNQHDLRFSVYSQERKSKGDLSPLVTSMLLRLWDFNVRKLGLDHASAYRSGAIDVYLCWGGKPGGEQLFDVDQQTSPATKVNTIYIYDLASFTDPVEMAREVAHEYGHAALPPIGGFQTPEDWANGYLGERLYLRMIRDEMATGHWGPLDTMLASQGSLDAWVKKNVDPLVVPAATEPPDKKKLSGTGALAMNAYMGLALYASEILPGEVFGRSLKLTGSTSATDYPEALVLASEEPDEYRIDIPEILKGKAVWVPTGKATLTGARILKRQGSWVQVQPWGGPITVRNPR